MLAHVMSIGGNEDKRYVFPIQATNHTREVDGLAPLILDLGTRYR